MPIITTTGTTWLRYQYTGHSETLAAKWYNAAWINTVNTCSVLYLQSGSYLHFALYSVVYYCVDRGFDMLVLDSSEIHVSCYWSLQLLICYSMRQHYQ